MAAGVFPPAWQEVALITIKPHNAAAFEFMAVTETVDISEPDYPGEGKVSLAGGRIWMQSPQEDGEVTLELYPIRLDIIDNGGLEQWFNGGTIDAAEPYATDIAWPDGVQATRGGFLVAILWTNDINAADAITQLGTSGGPYTAKRFYAKNARITSHKAAFT